MPRRRLVACAAALLSVAGAACGTGRQLVLAPGALGAADVEVVAGDLSHHALTDDLFHVDALWMQARPGTAFFRWLQGASSAPMAVVLTTDPRRFGDKRNVRILTGTLVHNTAPNEYPIVHILYLVDPSLGAISPITLQTDDPLLAAKFDQFDNAEVSVILIAAVHD